MTIQERLEQRLGIRHDWQRYTISLISMGIMIWAIWTSEGSPCG